MIDKSDNSVVCPVCGVVMNYNNQTVNGCIADFLSCDACGEFHD